MKLIIIFILGLLSNSQAWSSGHRAKMIRCSIKHIPESKIWVEDQTYNRYDKFKHCAVSCYLDLRCGRGQVGLVGVLKEIWDAFGPGNAELADLKADFYGLKLVKKKLATNDDECAMKCDERYPGP